MSFAAIAALTALVTIGVLSFVWDQHFKTYTNKNMQELASQISVEVSKGYRETGSLTSDKAISNVQTLISDKNTRVQIFSSEIDTSLPPDRQEDRVPDWDSAAIQFGTGLLYNKMPEPSNAQTRIATIKVNDITVGYVRVYVYGSDTLLSQADEEFRANSYQAMIFASVFAIILALCIGFLFARNLVNPINRMMRTAEAITGGDMSARTELRGDDEIARLGETFDEMADSIEKDRKLERRLTTDVAHELRTPLMAIQSTVEAMIDGIFEADVERLETVNSEVERLSRLVDALLRLARLENRSTPMNKEVLDVGTLISTIVATHEAFVADSGLELSFHAEPEVLVSGDADMIRQVVANLISNAVRYTPEGGNIDIQVRKGDIMALISVKDTGIGLTSEEARMVFSRFWRADSGRDRESGGLGVGLTVVKEIVDRHGGWVNVEGKPNEGATFTVYIPLYNEEEARTKRPKEKKSKR